MITFLTRHMKLIIQLRISNLFARDCSNYIAPNDS